MTGFTLLLSLVKCLSACMEAVKYHSVFFCILIYLFLLHSFLVFWDCWSYTLYGQHHVIICLRPYAGNKGPDQPAHICSLIKVFPVR